MGKPLEERFWSKVQKTETCWIWTGALNSKGYGSFGFGPPRGRTALASRVSWLIHYGVMPDQWVLHRCDNGRCVRPDHLFLGNNQANMNDMWAKGRGVLPKRQPTVTERARGSRHGVAKLTEEQVAEIRQRYGAPTGRPQKGAKRAQHPVSQKQLADEYGVHQTIISDIVRHEYWQHVV